MILFNETEISAARFPDGSLHLTMPEDIDALFSTRQYGRKITWRYEGDHEIFTLLCLARKLQEQHRSAYLYMPYIPHARMDRAVKSQDVFTLKYFAELLNSMNFSSVTVLDPHSDVSAGLIDRVKLQKVQPFIDSALDISGADTLLFPDSGAQKRYGGMYPEIPQICGFKIRDWGTGKILRLELNTPVPPAGRKVLIVDDICSRGGTFLQAAEEMKRLGAKEVSLYVSHCENTVLQGDLINSGLLSRIYTTDSIYSASHDLIHVQKLA